MMMHAALALAAKGLRVFPCKVHGKQPLTPHGCLDASANAETIRAWWEREPEANIGIATGTVSGVFAIDIDDGMDGEFELRRLEAEHGPLPQTVEVITGSGRHMYFKMPQAEVRNSAGDIAPKIDVRGSGGYCLAPPSVHPSGRRYTWSVDSANSFAAAPEWLLERICSPTNGASLATPTAEWRALVQGVGEGARDCTLTRLAGYLLRHFVDPYVVSELLHAFNIERCRPPLPAEDVERIVNSIAARELARRNSRG